MKQMTRPRAGAQAIASLREMYEQERSELRDTLRDAEAKGARAIERLAEIDVALEELATDARILQEHRLADATS